MLGNGVGTAHGTGEPPETASDAALVRLARGAPCAFEPLYLRYRDRVLAYCYRHLGTYTEAEDAASAVFVAALRGLAEFRNRDDAFRPWLFRIAHNEVAMRHRYRSRHPQAPLAAAGQAVDPAASPEAGAVLADDQRRLATHLAGLPPRERAVLELRVADLTTAEIANVLGIHEQAVRTAQSRAIARLRAAIGITGAAGREAADA
jgi:RNA polymerase sigma-70 factor (ECF subfamily)